MRILTYILYFLNSKKLEDKLFKQWDEEVDLKYKAAYYNTFIYNMPKFYSKFFIKWSKI